MHFFEFLQLQEDEQLETLWYNGEQVGRRKEAEFLILLYQVEGFYVEVYYHSREKQIKKYLSFEDPDKLEPYLEEIDISPVYRYMKRRPRKSLADPIDSLIGDVLEIDPAVAKAPASPKSWWQRIWAKLLK